MPPRNSAGLSLRQGIRPYLTTIAHGSTPFITTFLLIHLTAPVLVNLGGSSLASQTMILGREYYQTSFGEKYLVLGPLAVHSLSSIAKRIIAPPSTPTRPLTSLLSMTGYTTMLLLLPVHFLIHRVNPTTVGPPIFAIGPAELDYEFVKFGLQKWPWRSWTLYGGLVACVALHATDGMHIIWNTWLNNVQGWWRGSSRNRRLATAVGGLILPVLSGIFMLSREPLMTFSSTAKRFHAVFTKSIFYCI